MHPRIEHSSDLLAGARGHVPRQVRQLARSAVPNTGIGNSPAALSAVDLEDDIGVAGRGAGHGEHRISVSSR